MENVKVTLVKSLIACKKNQIATAAPLALKDPVTPLFRRTMQHFRAK